MELKVFLKNLPAFEDFTNQDLDLFATLLHVGEYEDGHTFIRQNVQGEALFLVMQGVVSVTKRDSEESEDHEVRVLHDGELFGVLSLVGDLPASATCTAKGKVQAAALTREAFLDLFHRQSPIGHRLQFMIAGQMARDLREANRTMRTALRSA
jgi:CRP/FNR family transcriptional regulator/CRP/FNR family cyclic AMP-dependent transcriptional regulator